MSDLGQQLISSVRAHAAARPLFVYESPFNEDSDEYGNCVYIHNGYASCLIGQALFDCGLIDASFENLSENHLPVLSLLQYLEIDLDNTEFQWLRAVQHWQDRRYPWRHAVELSDAEVTP